MNSSSLGFVELGVPRSLVDVLHSQGITDPFPVQRDTLPDSLAGRDVLGRGKTGSGKTLAFAIPLVARLAANRESSSRGNPRALILAPTRELVNQINTVLNPLAKASRLKTTTIYGGVNQNRQVSELDRGIDIIVACPGRLEDLLQQRLLTLKDIEITVLDEADHMADLGFLPAVTRLLRQIPRDGQKMLFSATLDRGVDNLVDKFLTDAVSHSVDDETSPVADMNHYVFEVGADDKKPLITALASGKGRRILFTRTKHQAKRLAKQLTSQGIPAVDLHGNLSQSKRDHNLAAFGDGKVRVLVATDVAARGVHVDSVELVVHVDPPMEHKSYLHRSGRTARAGHAGDVVTVVLPEQRKDTAHLMRKAAIKVQPQSVNAQSQIVQELVGEHAAFVKPAPVANQNRGQSAQGKSQGANAQRKRAARGALATKSNRREKPASTGAQKARAHRGSRRATSQTSR